MARPWPKRSAWPYLAKSGLRSYNVASETPELDDQGQSASAISRLLLLGETRHARR
jgi:hypothetical protein